ncbi:MAG: hypothetical protein ACQUHE_08545 [Bacteroidia bacterium]
MKKFQLHQNDIKELQQMLYALPDHTLAKEAFNLRTDFKKWVKTKFELTDQELDFLNQLNHRFIEYAAIKSSNFLAERKPIQFSVVEFKPDSDVNDLSA